MKAFVSWSSGKDCMYALYKYLQNPENEVFCLLNMTDEKADKSRSHGISSRIILRQAEDMDIPIMQCPTSRADYEQNLKKVIRELKVQGVSAGVFGDIYLQEHRNWIERVCAEMDIVPIFPLWGADTEKLTAGFIANGFRAITVAIRKNLLPKQFLGRVLDEDFLQTLRKIPNADVCGENGEYHTFVFDGPLFTRPVPFQKGLVYEDDKHYFLELN